jgi:hypothetical protein
MVAMALSEPPSSVATACSLVLRAAPLRDERQAEVTTSAKKKRVVQSITRLPLKTTEPFISTRGPSRCIICRPSLDDAAAVASRPADETGCQLAPRRRSTREGRKRASALTKSGIRHDARLEQQQRVQRKALNGATNASGKHLADAVRKMPLEHLLGCRVPKAEGRTLGNGLRAW